MGARVPIVHRTNCATVSGCLAVNQCGKYADVRVPLCHVQVEQPLERDEAQRGMYAAVCGDNYAATQFAYGPLSRANLREIGDSAHGLLDEVRRANASCCGGSAHSIASFLTLFRA